MENFLKEYTFDEDITLLLRIEDWKENIIIKIEENNFDITKLLDTYVVDNLTKKIIKKNDIVGSGNEYININIDYLMDNQGIILNLLGDLITNNNVNNILLKDIYNQYWDKIDDINKTIKVSKEKYLKQWEQIALFYDKGFPIIYVYPTFQKLYIINDGTKDFELAIIEGLKNK